MSTTTTQGGAATVRRFYERIAGGDLEGALALMHEDLVIHEPKELPYGGEYHGATAFTDVMGQIMAVAEPSVVGESRYLETTDGPVLVTLRGRFTSKTTGESAETDVVEIFSFRDGKVVELDIYYKDPGAIAALFS